MRLTLIALLLLAVSPATAGAADFFVSDVRQEKGSMLYAQSAKQGSMRIVVERGGATALDVSNAMPYARGSILTQAGDVLKIFQPADAATPVAMVPLDGRPTIDRICAGQTSFSGLQNAAGRIEMGRTYNPFSNRSGDLNFGVVSRTGAETYMVQLQRAARLGEVAVAFQRLSIGTVDMSTSTNVPVQATCTVTPPVPAATDGLASFRKRDIRPLPTGVRVKISCAKLSTIPCAGKASLRAPKTAGSKAFTIAPGKSKRVTVKLSRTALKKLRKKRKLIATLVVATKNQAGAALTKSAKVTLRTKKKKR